MVARPRAQARSAERPTQKRPGPVTRHTSVASVLSGLTATAGNRAVARLVRSLQRDDTKPPPQKPKRPDYTQPVADVKKTGITRLEVHDLKYGVEGFKSDYANDSSEAAKKKYASDEANKTAEKPNRMAVVLVPDTLDLDKPVQVIVHFHGWGFRTWDPYAGYLVAKGPSPAAGTVRDVDQEHWEQQISSLKGQGAQVVAILAQGRGKSDFGSFPTFDYVRDVFEKSGRPELKKLAENDNYSVILSAHSGGGSTKVVPALGKGEAETADPAGVQAKLKPVDLVVLYEALNGDSDVEAVMQWVNHQLDRLVPALDQDPVKACAATPTLRGYYGKRDDSGYRELYRWLACLIKEAIEKRVPEEFRSDVADRFRIVEVTGPKGEKVEHEQVISGVGAESSGSLADALLASRDPTSDRDQAVVPDADECKKLKKRARDRAEAAAKAAAAARAAKAAKTK